MSKEMQSHAKALEFLQKIDDWIADRNADLVQKNERIEYIINLPSEEINKMTPSSALAYSYVLFAHSEYLQTLYNKEKSVVDFCDNSIWFIISDKLKNYGGQYSKWQEKYFSAVKENPLASELNKLKLAAEARINRLSGKSDVVKKMGTILQDIGRKRGY